MFRHHRVRVTAQHVESIAQLFLAAVAHRHRDVAQEPGVLLPRHGAVSRHAAKFLARKVRQLFERRIFPCIDISRSGTRKEEKLYGGEELSRVHLLRRALSTLSPVEAMSTLISRLEKFPNNTQFLRSVG